MVLLKNNNHVLPLKKGLKVALFGNASYETIIGGTGSGQVNTAYTVFIADGLVHAGYLPNEDLKINYLGYIQKDKIAHPKKQLTLGTPRLIPELEITRDIIEKTASEADIAIYTLGRNAGEGADRTIQNNFNLTDSEKISIKNIADLFHAKNKKLVAILNIGGVIETASWSENADALLLAWQPGIEAGNAIGDILNGTVNPSGKLATTFPLKYEDEPSSKNFPGIPANRPTEVIYEEGIYVGYRYFNSFGIKTAFPFGFGTSYTSFSYLDLKLSNPVFSNHITATVTVKNTGKLAGKEVVELYLTAPHGQLEKPAEELKAFGKTRMLNPGESQSLTFQLHTQDLASFNTSRSAWVADAGDYILKIGASSEDIRLTKKFSLTKGIVTEKVNKALAPQISINELKR